MPKVASNSHSKSSDKNFYDQNIGVGRRERGLHIV
jgi:hypothetical protein